MVNQQLLVEFLRVYAFQPATALWRAVEVNVLRKYLPTSGLCLDLGCGDGKLTAIAFDGIRTPDLTLVGIDADEDEVDYARRFSFYSRLHVCRASDIPEASASFDFIFSNSVLEHIEDIEATLAEMSRLLKPQGTLVFTVPSPGFHTCLRGPRRNGMKREQYLSQMDRRLAHLRYWSVAEWRAHLANCGLTIEASEEYLNIHEVRRWETVSNLTAGILYAFFGQKRSPIQIQKQLGLRHRQSMVLPRWAAVFLASLLTAFLKSDTDKTPNGCLLILARKEGK